MMCVRVEYMAFLAYLILILYRYKACIYNIPCLNQSLMNLYSEGTVPRFSIWCVQYINVFVTKGFTVESPIGPLKSKVMLLQCSVDLPARAMVSNTKQFNGKHGCLYCYHPGKTEGSNHLQVIP